MIIRDIETYTVSAGWKNWLFIKVLTDTEYYGIGEATINGFIKTTEAAVHELKHFAIGRDDDPDPQRSSVHSYSLNSLSVARSSAACRSSVFA